MILTYYTILYGLVLFICSYTCYISYSIYYEYLLLHQAHTLAFHTIPFYHTYNHISTHTLLLQEGPIIDVIHLSEVCAYIRP